MPKQINPVMKSRSLTLQEKQYIFFKVLGSKGLLKKINLNLAFPVLSRKMVFLFPEILFHYWKANERWSSSLQKKYIEI